MPDAELSLNLFPTTKIVSINGLAVAPCEVVGDGIAVTPFLSLGEGTYELGGGFNVTHRPTGRTFAAGQACIECARETARRLAATGVDWKALDITSAETMKSALGEHRGAVDEALRLFGQCAQQCCFHDEEQCDACGMTKQHAPYCIAVVGPMVAEHNARVLGRTR